MAPTRIAELAAIVAANTSKIDDYLSVHHIPSPSFEPGVPQLPDDVKPFQQAVLRATDELNALLLGPAGMLRQAAVVSVRTRKFSFSRT